MSKKGSLIIISAPAGAGKTTLAHLLLKAHPGTIVQSVSCTTRPKRASEVDGHDYHFLTEEEFIAKKERGEFLETAAVFKHLYGTLKSDVQNLIDEGRHVLLVIDVQGAKQIKQDTPALTIFIEPPSLEVLKERLLGRKSESEESLQLRMHRAKSEIEEASHYDYVIVNDNLDHAFAELNSIIQKEIYD